MEHRTSNIENREQGAVKQLSMNNGQLSPIRSFLPTGQTIVNFFMVLLLLFPFCAYAGSLDSSAAPSSSSSAMYTLEDIYNRLNDGTAATKRAGSFTEPGAGPASTGKTLDELMSLVDSHSRVAKTGQTTSYDGSSLDDGGLGKGVSWPSPRFTASNGTVTDNLTGLIWLQDANCYGTETWADAITNANALANGTCSLTDSSSAGDWRLPNVKELLSLIDFAFSSPALSDAAGTAQWTTDGDAFTGVQSNYYWSGTTYSASTSYAWRVTLNDGSVYRTSKTNTTYVWPVRGGQ